MMRNALITSLVLLQTTFLTSSKSPEYAEPDTIASTWQMPFETPHRLVRQYLQPNSDYSAGHRGVDFVVSIGDKLVSPADGTVTVAKQIVNRPVIVISHGADLVTELEPACSSLPPGSAVSKGQPIGFACEADVDYKQHCPDEICLHFSLRVGGRYLSPLTLIGGLNPSRLLPELPVG
jgi:murein DD-endopeptidase MepM/ murein hydrolase activator NlpD